MISCENLDPNTFGGRLFYMIKCKKYTLGEFSEMVGIGRRSLYRYICENQYPTVDILIKICKILDTNPNYLLGVY